MGRVGGNISRLVPQWNGSDILERLLMVSDLRNVVRQLDSKTTTDGKLNSLLQKVMNAGSKEQKNCRM